MPHPNEQLMRRGYEAFAKGDLETVMSITDEAAVYHIGGRNPLAGDYKGHQAIQGFFSKLFELSEGTFSLEPHDYLANDDHVVVMARATAQRQGKTLDTSICHIWHVSNGMTTEFWGLDVDPYGSDAFWS